MRKVSKRLTRVEELVVEQLEALDCLKECSKASNGFCVSTYACYCAFLSKKESLPGQMKFHWKQKLYSAENKKIVIS